MIINAIMVKPERKAKIMINDKKLRINDKVIQYSKVYTICKIEKLKVDNQEKIVIFFKPYYKNEYNNNLIISVPLDNLKRANIRLPFSKKKLAELLENLGKKPELDLPVDIAIAKETLSLNDPDKNANILKSLWHEQCNESVNFTQSKKAIFKQSFNQLVEEVAFVSGSSLLKASEIIKKILNKRVYNSNINP